MKVAVVIGINYRASTDGKLRGCHNDAWALAELLMNRGFYVMLLVDDGLAVKPTHKNILEALSQMSRLAREEAFFSFSGHGIRIHDTNGDELDGLDEAIVPADFLQSGPVPDDALVDTLRAMQCPLTILMDCCHSGTSFDLPFRWYEGLWQRESGVALKTDIKMISGSHDNETSADAKIHGRYRGAMTTAFIECWEEGISMVILLERMRDYVKMYRQTPQLSASRSYPMTMPFM